jgi:hypothetical protein
MRACVTALMFIMFLVGCGSSEPAPDGSGTAPVATPTTTATTTKFVDEGGAMTLADALDQLARSGSANFVMDPSVSFTAPVDADVRRRANATGTWRGALDLVATSAGCVVEQRADGAYVIKPAPR